MLLLTVGAFANFVHIYTGVLLTVLEIVRFLFIVFFVFRVIPRHFFELVLKLFKHIGCLAIHHESITAFSRNLLKLLLSLFGFLHFHLLGLFEHCIMSFKHSSTGWTLFWFAGIGAFNAEWLLRLSIFSFCLARRALLICINVSWNRLIAYTLVIYLEALSRGFKFSVRSLLLADQVRIHLIPLKAISELDWLCNSHGIVSAEWSTL